jgi:hypothetical protein
MAKSTIVGLRFNDRGVETTDAEIQATWAAHVAAERAILNLDQPGRRCAHLINIDRAGCGKCEGL